MVGSVLPFSLVEGHRIGTKRGLWYFYYMKRLLTILLFLPFSPLVQAQSAQGSEAAIAVHEETIRNIYDKALTNSSCYENLRYLCKEIGGRLSGSENAAKSVEFVYETFEKMGLDRVEKQPCMVPHWERGNPETAWFKSDAGKFKVPVCALGGSIPTGKKGIKTQVVEVFSLEEVAKLSRSEVEGKIVFFNRPMEPTYLNTFAAYSGCVDQRSSGAIEAGTQGAAAVVVRSMNLRMDDFPHTGGMRYKEGVNRIPACAISTNGAELLHEQLEKDPDLEFFLQMNCKTFPDAPSHNVIGEIKGSEFPDEIILVGGHLDSWDLGEGAQDDGAGAVQAMEVLNLFKLAGYKPKRTIRAVAFMNEENGMRGAIEYGRVSEEKKENHIAAIESDRGGFTPRGFTVQNSDENLKFVQDWKELLDPYMLHEIMQGYGGVDISPLKFQGTTLIGFLPDSQRYFDFHHAASDVFEAVNKRELELGAASMAGLVYLIDQYGLPKRGEAPAPKK